MAFLRKRSSKRSTTASTTTSTSLSSSPSTTVLSASAQEMPRSRITHHPSTSTSNLSTTSTLLNTESSPRAIMSTRTTSYEAFLHHARLDAERSGVLRAEQHERAWREAEIQRRSQGAALPWPHDPWRGGFGPSDYDASRGDGTAEGRRAVKEWLRENGLLKSSSKAKREG